MVWKGNWPDEVKAFALKSAADGKSANAISAQILRIFNVDKSRNAVIGLVHRSGKTLGTNGRASMSANGKRTGPMAAAIRRHRMNPKAPIQITPRFSTEPLPPPHEIDIPRIKTADLEEHHCRWPCGDPREPDFGFCGKSRVPGFPYCDPHARRAYPPPQARNRLPVPRPTPAIPLLEDA